MRINLTNRVDEVYSKGILRLPKPWMNKKVCCPIAQFRPWLLENICKGQMITSDCKFHAPLPSYSSHSRPQINGAKIMEYIHPSIYAPQNENAIIEGHLWFSARMSEMTFLDQNIQCQSQATWRFQNKCPQRITMYMNIYPYLCAETVKPKYQYRDHLQYTVYRDQLGSCPNS